MVKLVVIDQAKPSEVDGVIRFNVKAASTPSVSILPALIVVEEYPVEVGRLEDRIWSSTIRLYMERSKSTKLLNNLVSTPNSYSFNSSGSKSGLGK